MLIQPKTISEAMGLWVGGIMGPVFGLGAALRRARFFHPAGTLFFANIHPVKDTDAFSRALAKSLFDPAESRLHNRSPRFSQ